MDTAQGRPRVSRETRLLVITLVVSTAALLLLSRFRFPEPRSEAPVPAPLERLAARAPFEELSGIISQLERRIAPAVVVLRVSPPDRSQAAAARKAPLSTPPTPARFVPAIRTAPETALALLEPDARVEGVVGYPDAAPVVLATDPLRHLSLVRVPQLTEPIPAVWDRTMRPDPHRYVAAVEATQGGHSVRPVFLGRTDPVTDPRWDHPLLVAGGVLQTAPGSLLMSLDGRFVGLAVLHNGFLAIAPADALAEIAERLAYGDIHPGGSLGISAQPLTPTLAAATGATHGVVVNYLEPTGPAAELLEIADVIEAIGDQPVYSPEHLMVTVARTLPATELRLQVRRKGELLDVPVVVGAEMLVPEPLRRAELGLLLRSIPGAGSEVVRVTPEAMGAVTGVLPGDIITHFNGITAPTPTQIQQSFNTAAPSDLLIVAVERDGRPLLLVLEKPPRA